jgi:hypothetical protein
MAEEPRARPANPFHSRTVVRTVAAWLGVHLLALVILGLPGYLSCTSASGSGDIFGCGGSFGLIALLIAGAQTVYGLIGGVILIRYKAAIAQGVLIGTAIAVFLFTAVCFAAAIAL